MNESKEFSHLTRDGDLHMVPVGEKPVTQRVARAEAILQMKKETAEAIRTRSLKKGDLFAVVKIAGINAAKETARLIPLCHSLALDKVDIAVEEIDSPDRALASYRIESVVSCHGKTGVEMEALTAVSVAALAFYDMCKAIDREMTVEKIRLIEKSGGKSDYLAED